MTTREFIINHFKSEQSDIDYSYANSLFTRIQVEKLMEEYAKYILDLTQPNIVGDSMNLDILDHNPDEVSEWNNLHFSEWPK